VRRPDVASLRAAWWTLRSARCARRQVENGGLEAVALGPPPPLPEQAIRGVGAVLRRRDDSCLVRARVRPRWHAAHGTMRDLVIGVTPPSGDFTAHAWLDGDQPCHHERFRELSRRPARA
jgi:hypothetical protein